MAIAKNLNLEATASCQPNEITYSTHGLAVERQNQVTFAKEIFARHTLRSANNGHHALRLGIVSFKPSRLLLGEPPIACRREGERFEFKAE